LANHWVGSPVIASKKGPNWLFSEHEVGLTGNNEQPGAVQA
jgi:hypothetical protein